MGSTILIVDNEAIIAMSLKACLQERGFNTIAIAATGKEAIRGAKKYSPDLILMDVRLRGELNGYEAMAEIRKQSQTPVIYLTGGDQTEVEFKMKTTPPNDYVIKPFDIDELVGKMRKLLRESNS